MSCRSFYEKVKKNEPVNLPNGSKQKVVEIVQLAWDGHVLVDNKYKKVPGLRPHYHALFEVSRQPTVLSPYQHIRCSDLFNIN